MNLRCRLGYHKWKRVKFTRFEVIYQCTRCGKTARKLLPPEVVSMSIMLETVEAVVGTLSATVVAMAQGTEEGKKVLDAWVENIKKQAQKREIEQKIEMLEAAKEE